MISSVSCCKAVIASKEATAVIEIIFGVLFFIQTVLAVYMGYLGWVPFLILIQFGFLYTGLLSIFHGSGKKGAAPGIGAIIPEPALQREKDF